MKRQFAIILTLILVVILAGFTVRRTTTDDVIYPEGYRKWTHVKSALLSADHPNVKYRGFNHIYANEKAIIGYETGTFPDGSIIVFDVIEAKFEKDHTDEAKRNHVDVMVKDSQKFATTGGWNFGQFEADKTPRNITDAVKAKCSSCHASQGDHVFSEFRQ
jgi:hypothetical protein